MLPSSYTLLAELTASQQLVENITGFLNHWFAIIPVPMLLGILMTGDIITGIWLALKRKGVSSTISIAGMMKKCQMATFVAIGGVLEIVLHFPLSGIFALGYLKGEAISIAENMAACGAPVPPVVLEYLEKIQMAKLNKLDQKLIGGPLSDRIIASQDKTTEAVRELTESRVINPIPVEVVNDVQHAVPTANTGRIPLPPKPHT